MYYWAMNELLSSDRPNVDQIDNDDRFDAWLIMFERKMNQQASKK